MNWSYGHNFILCPRRTVKLGFTDLIRSTVRLQFCISKTAVNRILGMKGEHLKKQL